MGRCRSASTSQFKAISPGPLVWQGQDLQKGCEVVPLEVDDVASIRDAVAQCKASVHNVGDVTRDNFGLSAKLHRKLRDVSHEIHKGRGFAVLRGLNQAGFDDERTEDSTIAFAGLAAHVCPYRAASTFSGRSLALEHIYDGGYALGHETQDGPELASTKLPTKLHFHADRFNGDVLALYVRDPGNADEGEQYLASFPAVFNKLLSESPHMLQVLAAENWPFTIEERFDQAAQIKPGPVIFLEGSNIPICQLVMEPLLGKPRDPRPANAPSISKEQREAINRIQELATSGQYELDRQLGDVQFVNNLALLHARNKYSGSNGRHLLRMFLRDPTYAWPKPTGWATLFDRPFEPSASGVSIDHVDKTPYTNVFLHG